MIGVFDSGFGWLQTLKYRMSQFPYENFLFLADSKHVPYGDKDSQTIKNLTIQHISWLLDQWCDKILIACNTAVASIYHHRFPPHIEQKLIGVTKYGIKDAILSHHKHIAVFCTQATHNLKVYPQIYQELQGDGIIYTIPTPALVPLIEANDLNYNQVYHHISQYKKQVANETDCLILWCTHYPILINIFWEQFPRLKIIDPGRSTISVQDSKLYLAQPIDQSYTGQTHIYCTWSVEKFILWAHKIRKTGMIPPVSKIEL